MKKNNIIFNKTLKQYNKKYRHRKYRLLKLSKKEVEDFDNYGKSLFKEGIYNKKYKNYLINERKWADINESYYEIPRPIRFTWFRNLHAGVKTACCLLGAGAVTSAIVVPLVILKANTSNSYIDSTKSKEVKIKKDYVDSNGNRVIALETSNKSKEVTSVTVKIESNTLKKGTEFTFDKNTQEVLIYKSTLEKYPGKICIDPEIKDKEDPVVPSIKLNKSKYSIGLGDTFKLIATVTPKTKTVKWTSSNPNIVSVEQDGTITAKDITNKGEKVIITATADDLIATCEITTFNCYKVDWNTTKFFDNGTKTVHDKIATEYDAEWEVADEGAHKIELIYSNDESIKENEVQIGESSDDKIYALWDDNDRSFTVRSKYKIRFEDNDNPSMPETGWHHSMFYNCGYCSSLNLENIDTSLMTDFAAMFDSVGYELTTPLDTIDVSTIDTTNAKQMYWMFEFTRIKHLDLSTFDTSNVVNMNDMFYDSISLESVNVSSFNTSKVIDMNCMFDYCQSLKKLDISNFDTSNVIDMSYMFENCEALEAIDLSNFNTGKVENMRSMFECCYKLETLDLSNFNTSACTNMTNMFYGCELLESVDISNFDTHLVESMSSMFRECKKIKSLDLKHFDTSSLVEINNMFCECNDLAYLDITSFDTSHVKDFSQLFCNTYNLKTIDLSSFDTTNAENTKKMFLCEQDNNVLKTIYVSNKFNLSNVTESEYMFQNLHALEGGAGTKFDESAVNDKTRAIIDGGEGNPGYFTEKK